MSTTLADDRPVDPDDELLVAYLDGELDTAERDEVEQRLMDDQRLRNRLQSLQSSWDLLDDLPVATTNDQLVESTLELVVSDIVSKSSIQPAHVEKSRWPIVLAAMGLFSAVLAFGVVRWMQRQQLRQELEDIALAENLDAYLYGQDLKLMRELAAEPKWIAMIKAAKEFGGFSSDNGGLVADTPAAERATAIAKLSLEERAQLETRWDRFRRMEDQYRESVRTTAKAVAAQPDPELLLATMNTYAAWRDTIPDDLRDGIEKGSGDQRKDAINDAISRSMSQIRRQSGKSLDEGTTKLIYATLEHFFDRRLSEDAELAESIEQLGIQFNNPDGPRRIAMRRMLGDVFRQGGRGPGPTGPIESIRPITDEELWSIIDILNASNDEHADALDKLDTLTQAGSFVDRDAIALLTVRDWTLEAFDRNLPSPERDDQSLVQRYREIDSDVRDGLDLLPPERMKAELDRLANPRRFSGPFRRRPPPR